MKPFSIAIHGGAGTLLRSSMTPEKAQQYRDALKSALDIGYLVLSDGGNATEAVRSAVESLENCPLFNAGKGSVFTSIGTHEMDAAIMDGRDRQAGAIAMVTGIKNPINLAFDVLYHSEHVLLASQGALEFAKSRGYSLENSEYFYDELRYKQWQDVKGTDKTMLDHTEEKNHKFGTVGAVACDTNGHIAAATSTGGMTNKKFGRIGDSPIIGSGTYANDSTCAISCTGSGEFFMRGAVAYDVACLVEHKEMGLQEACDEVIQKRLLALGGDGGLIGINNRAEIALSFNTEGMYRGFKTSSGLEKLLIYEDES